MKTDRHAVWSQGFCQNFHELFHIERRELEADTYSEETDLLDADRGAQAAVSREVVISAGDFVTT